MLACMFKSSAYFLFEGSLEGFGLLNPADGPGGPKFFGFA